jgi:hypothetical protein
LALLGFFLFLMGAVELLGVFASFFKIAWGTGPAAGRQASVILIAGLPGLAALLVAYAIWKERAWGRPALILFVLLAVVIQGWLASAILASLVASALGLVFISCYLYLWPNVVDYYRWLPEAGDSSEEPPNSGVRAGC